MVSLVSLNGIPFSLSCSLSVSEGSLGSIFEKCAIKSHDLGGFSLLHSDNARIRQRPPLPSVSSLAAPALDMNTNASTLSREQAPLLVDLEKQASPSGPGMSAPASTTQPSSLPVIPEPSSRPVGWTVFALTIKYPLALEDSSMQVMGQVYESHQVRGACAEAARRTRVLPRSRPPILSLFHQDTVNAARRCYRLELAGYDPDRIILSVAYDRESTSPLVGELGAGQVRPLAVIVPEEAWSMVLADGVPRSVRVDVSLNEEQSKQRLGPLSSA